jgi:hypothetical protein
VETPKEIDLLGDPTELGRTLQGLLVVNPDSEFIVWRRGDTILIRHDWGMRLE